MQIFFITVLSSFPGSSTGTPLPKSIPPGFTDRPLPKPADPGPFKNAPTDPPLELSVTGIGDAVRRASVSNVNYTHLIPDTILVSNVSAITFGNDTASSVVRIQYFPEKVGTPSNLSMFVKNETSGSFDSLPFTLDTGNKIVSSTVTASGEYCVMDKELWDARFVGSGQQQMAMTAKTSTVKVPEFVYVDSPANRTLLSASGSGTNSTTLSPTKGSSLALVANQASSTSASTMAGTGQYEAVLNGDFSNGMAFWTPNGPDTIPSTESAYFQIMPDTTNYYSSPSSLKMQLHLRPPTGTAINYDISHSDIYLSGATTLSFRYMCSEIQRANSNTAAGMTVSLYNSAGTQVAYKDFTFTGTTSWTTGSFPVTGYTGAYRIVFSPRISGYPSSRLYDDYMTINIDDVSATSDTPPSPTTANVRLCLFTLSGAPYISMGSVTLNDGSGTTRTLKKSGCTDAFIFSGGGGRQFQITTQDYPTKYLDSTILSGEQGTINVNVDGGSQQTTASLNVVSNPSGANILVNGVNYGTTPLSGVSVSTSGSPAITARLTGYKELTTMPFPKNPGNYDVPLSLEVARGNVYITSTPSGATATIGALNAGETPAQFTDLPVGTYTLILTRGYYNPYTTQVTVTDGQTTYVNANLAETNSDSDSLPDIREVQGYLDPFGNLRTSDPTIADTDTDGLTDDYEAGYLTTTLDGKSVWRVRCNPRMVDSDTDGLFDPDELDIGTKPLIPDTDGEGLTDFQEIERGTDPLDVNTDGDSTDDFTELIMYSWGAGVDPNVAITYGDKTPQQELETMVCGATLGAGGDIVSTCDTDSESYVIGWMLSPSGKVTAVRDFSFSGYKGDLIGAFLNAIQFKTVQKGMGKLVVPIKNFVIRNPHLTGDVGKVVSKYSDDVLQTRAILTNIHGDRYDDIVQKLGNGDEATVIQLYERGVNVKLLDDALTSAQIYDRYPGLGNFIARTLLNEEGLASRVTIDLTKLESAQKAGKTSSIQRWLGNIQGAYGEYKGKEAIYREGMTIIKDLSHVNKPGLDLVLKDGNTIKIIECKAVKDLSVSNLRNYLITDKTTGAITGYNAQYAVLEGLPESYFTDPTINKQFILYINSPESTAIKSKLNLPASVPYKYTKGSIDYTGTVQVIVMAE